MEATGARRIGLVGRASQDRAVAVRAGASIFAKVFATPPPGSTPASAGIRSILWRRGTGRGGQNGFATRLEAGLSRYNVLGDPRVENCFGRCLLGAGLCARGDGMRAKSQEILGEARA